MTKAEVFAALLDNWRDCMLALEAEFSVKSVGSQERGVADEYEQWRERYAEATCETT